ncbi:MAG: 4-hydroxy-tetrahydrodipicolinate synthase [Alphaproteobacteria bacterium]
MASSAAPSPHGFDLRGSICALATPFRNGTVDWSALKRLCAWHLAEGTDGLVVCGTTAENPTLGPEERRGIISTTVDVVAGRIPVIAGTGASDTAATILATQEATDLGADAALVVTPAYNRPSPAGLLAHYKAVHDNTRLPIVLYTVPARTGVDIDLDTLVSLAALERIIGIKDATSDMARVSLTRRLCGADFAQVSGEDGSAVGFNAHGGVGCISVTANVAPRECAALQRASLEGDRATALALQDRLMPLHRALFAEASPQPTKYALAARGLCTDEMRLPLVPASAPARAAVDAALAVAGLGPVDSGSRESEGAEGSAMAGGHDAAAEA